MITWLWKHEEIERLVKIMGCKSFFSHTSNGAKPVAALMALPLNWLNRGEELRSEKFTV